MAGLTFRTKPSAVVDANGAIAGYVVAATVVTPSGTLEHHAGFARLQTPDGETTVMSDHVLHPNPHVRAKHEATRDALRRCERRAGTGPIP